MSTKNTGGPAFPQPLAAGPMGDLTSSLDCEEGGMTIRDYFAAKAMQAMVTATYANEKSTGYCKWHAGHAYEMADAMLKARQS